MKKITDNWATVRMVVYSGIAVVCGGLVLAGILTEDQSHTYLGYIGSGLGALGVILASANVSKAPTVVAADRGVTVKSIEFSDPEELMRQLRRLDQLQTRVDEGVQQGRVVVDTAVGNAVATVEDLRRQAEQTFGEYR